MTEWITIWPRIQNRFYKYLVIFHKNVVKLFLIKTALIFQINQKLIINVNKFKTQEIDRTQADTINNFNDFTIILINGFSGAPNLNNCDN